MPIAPGTRFGHFEIGAPLGEGGMGEVYRAQDTRLGREVAIKVLSARLAEQPELKARFEREAQTISSLNHPNICTLFDVGREGDTDYLVMELIEGETLAVRLARGALPSDEALRIGLEIADALDRAHRAGVVHRDLKPGNVMLTRSGAKLMDFGLARAMQPLGNASTSFAPTLQHALTGEGMLVGTAPYMSPEQLEHAGTDERSDIWALGCVLYEMSTGKRAFEGGSQASLIKSILGDEPAPISQIAPTNPPALDRLVRACLTKDPHDRIQSAHDVKLQLQWIREGGSQAGVPMPVARRRKNRERLAWGVAIVALVAVATLSVLLLRPQPQAPGVRASLAPPPSVLYASSVETPLPLAISPDGSTIAFCARRSEGPSMLWVRSLDDDDAHPLAGTEGAEGPFFSPDGRSIAFFSDYKLCRIDAGGGPVIELVDDVDPRGGSWNQDGTIIFAEAALTPLSSISASGGTATRITELDEALGESTHRYPHFLPDGKHYLYLARQATTGGGRNPTIYAGELGSATRKAILEVASNAQYASGHLLYVRGGILMAQRFDASALELRGDAVPLLDDLRMDERFSRGVFAVSQNGVLIAMTGNDEDAAQLKWVDRGGRVLRDVGSPANYAYGGNPEISPDGKAALIAISEGSLTDLWVVDLDNGRRRKLTVDNRNHVFGIWTDDGQSVVAVSVDEHFAGIELFDLDGSSRAQIITDAEYAWPMTIHGDELIYTPPSENTQGEVLWRISISGEQRNASQVFDINDDQNFAQFSPDGRYLAYSSDASGVDEVYVAAYPQPGPRWQLSSGGGRQPRWSRNGTELYYLDRENYLNAVEVSASGATFRTGAARRLFQLFSSMQTAWRYDVSLDGQSFLITVPLQEQLLRPLTVMSDWTRKLEQR